MRATITTLRAFEVVGAVVGIMWWAYNKNVLNFKRGFVNRTLVRYKQTVDTKTA